MGYINTFTFMEAEVGAHNHATSSYTIGTAGAFIWQHSFLVSRYLN